MTALTACGQEKEQRPEAAADSAGAEVENDEQNLDARTGDGSADGEFLASRRGALSRGDSRPAASSDTRSGGRQARPVAESTLSLVMTLSDGRTIAAAIGTSPIVYLNGAPSAVFIRWRTNGAEACLARVSDDRGTRDWGLAVSGTLRPSYYTTHPHATIALICRHGNRDVQAAVVLAP